MFSLPGNHDERDGVSNHQPHDCLLNRLFRRRSKKTSKLRVTGLCAGNSSVTGEFPAQRASNAKNVSIWWRHQDLCHYFVMIRTHKCKFIHVFSLIFFQVVLQFIFYHLVCIVYLYAFGVKHYILCWFSMWLCICIVLLYMARSNVKQLLADETSW